MTDTAAGSEQFAEAFSEIERLHALIDMIPDAMVIIDKRGTIKAFSKGAEHMFGYSEKQVLGENVSVLMPSPDREAHDGYISHYLRTGEKRMIGTRRITTARRRNGNTFPIELSVGEMPVSGKRHFSGFIRDLTDSKQKEQTLQALQADLAHVSRISSMGGMANSIAHELNQPLTGITNYSAAAIDLLEDASASHIDDVRHALTECRKEALRAGDIIRKLREFIAHGDTTLEIADLRRLVNSATALALVNGDGRDVDFASQFDPRCENVLAVPVQIQQVLVNLIRNALEAMHETASKRIRVSSSYEPRGMVRVTVSDSGPGLDPHIAERLFHPFISTKASGMGLGLSICHTIINAHGGRIEAGPSELGGTDFSFTLKSAELGGDND
uniref:two-component system sensor histidine kinase NtrB n=1 Tax=Parerythrobacter lutipelagi TaxID=1964208 RepID=UPI0010F91C6D|nr:PAS domain-containing sensor histidine kinase [Parerythrobacter lutipelagi]